MAEHLPHGGQNTAWLADRRKVDHRDLVEAAVETGGQRAIWVHLSPIETRTKTTSEPPVNPGIVSQRERKEVGLGRASNTDNMSPIINRRPPCLRFLRSPMWR
jgi:hypothetical protein